MFLKKLLGAAALLGAALTANATTLEYGDNVYVRDGGNTSDVFDPLLLRTGVSISLNGGSSYQGQNAGIFVLDYSHTNAAPWTQFLAFCLQPNVALNPFDNPYAVTNGTPTYNMDAISELYGRFWSTVNTAVEAAAFQLSLWEIAFNPSASFDLTSGTFRSGAGDATTLAQTWLSQLDGTGPRQSGLFVLTDNPRTTTDRQDLVTVSEPAALALMGLGLLVFGIRRRRN